MTNTEAVAATLAVAFATALLHAAVGASLVLPIISAVCMIAAFSIGGLAWLRSSERKANSINSWDVAGALMLVGFAAATLSNPDAAMAAIEQSPGLKTALVTR